VLEEVGWVQQVIVNQRTGNLVDGHLRCQLAAREGNKTIPVLYVDIDEAGEELVLATLDPIAAMAATDKAKLDELFQDINSDNENVQKMISEIAEKEGLLGELPTLDELESKYGEPDETQFWPVIRLQVSPETMARYKILLDQLPGRDETEKFDALISGYGIP
jgi:ParB-like chromosome segregation protein Spo0J